jgi:hypothetical protein
MGIYKPPIFKKYKMKGEKDMCGCVPKGFDNPKEPEMHIGQAPYLYYTPFGG